MKKILASFVCVAVLTGVMLGVTGCTSEKKTTKTETKTEEKKVEEKKADGK